MNKQNTFQTMDTQNVGLLGNTHTHTTNIFPKLIMYIKTGNFILTCNTQSSINAKIPMHVVVYCNSVHTHYLLREHK